MKDITLKLLLNDKLTGALKSTVDKASNQLKGLQDKLNGLKTPNIPSGGLGSSGIGMKELVGANLLSSAITSVASSVLSAGEQLAASIGNAFNQAAEANRGSLGSTSAISALLNTSFQDAAKIQSQVSGELAESAKRLPGATKDYQEAFNGISDSLSLSTGLTKKGLSDQGKDIVELTALLGRASGAGSGATSTALGKMLGDQGSEALFRIDVFEKVPAFKAILEKGLAESGKTIDDFFKMDAKQKQEYLVKAKRTLFSADYLREMNQAADGQIDTMMSNLFDPQAGVFGFLRNIKLNGINTSVFNEFGKLFPIIGTAFESLTDLLGRLGFEFQDPMVSLANTLIGIGNFIKGITSVMDSFDVGKFDLGDAANKISSGITSLVGNSITSLTETLKGINWIDAGYTVTNGLLSGIKWLMDTMTAYLGQNSGVFIQVAFVGFQALMQGLSGVGIALRDNALPLIISAGMLAFQSLGVGLGVAISGLLGAVIGMVQGIETSFITGFNNIKNAIGSALSSVVSQAQSILSNLIPDIPGLGAASSRYQGQNLGLIGTAYNGNLLSALGTEMRNMPQGSHPVIANSSEIIVPRSKAGMLNNQINITINAQLDRVISEVTEALTVSLKPVSMMG